MIEATAPLRVRHRLHLVDRPLKDAQAGIGLPIGCFTQGPHRARARFTQADQAVEHRHIKYHRLLGVVRPPRAPLQLCEHRHVADVLCGRRIFHFAKPRGRLCRVVLVLNPGAECQAVKEAARYVRHVGVHEEGHRLATDAVVNVAADADAGVGVD